ncbi:MAG: hypothetical protein ACJ746_18960 [Bryobacteraceae bacterium]
MTEREWTDDLPDPPDEDDPAYQEEMFVTYKFQGLKPEDFRDPTERRNYAEWLNKQT